MSSPRSTAASRGADRPPAVVPPVVEPCATGPAAVPCAPNRRKILAGAREVFMECGFDRASVDAIAARAGVAKATVYNHFQDKAQLFVASFSEEADCVRAELVACLTAEPEGSVETALERAGEKLVTAFLSPVFVSLYRQTSAECARFPEIGRTLFERGPALVLGRIEEFLARWVERGALRIDDLPSAAVQLNMLWQGNLFFRAQMGVLEHPSEEAVRQMVRRGVRVFLAAYGAPAGG